MTDELPPVIVVTGTDTGVGKTVVTAALCAALARLGPTAAYKPVQTGVPGEAGTTEVGADISEIDRLAGPAAVFEGARLVDPLAPTTAARRQGAGIPTVVEHASRVDALTGEFRHVVVEGAGGLLVGLDGEGRTLANLAAGLRSAYGFLVVCRAGLGTLNHAALTVEALRHKDLPVIGVVIGSWPAQPGLAEQSNLSDLPTTTGVPLVGRLPEGAATWEPAAFRAAAPAWFRPPIGSWGP